MSYDLITVGRANMDLFAQEIGAEFEDIKGFDAAVGGSPTNIAIGAARLGLEVIAFTGVGTDRVGDFILRNLAEEGVTIDFIARIAGKLTSLALLGIKPPAEFPLSFYRNDPADIYVTVDHARSLPLQKTRAVLVSGNAFSRGPMRAATEWILQRAGDQRLVSFLDLDLRPVEWAGPGDFGRSMRRALTWVDVAIGTEEEVHEALAPDPQRVMERGLTIDEAQRAEVMQLIGEAIAADGGVGTVVLKRGPGGAAVIMRNEAIEVPGFPVEVVNTVGAGDAFASGLIAKRLAGWQWNQAVRFANACGALVVTRHGCSAALPTEDEVMDFIESHGGL